MDILSDICQYLKNDLTNSKTTQQIVGLKQLFSSFIIKDWKVTTNTSWFRKANKIIIRECVNYYY